jgi:hypothetical protein
MAEGRGIDVEIVVRGDAEAVRRKIALIKGIDSFEVLPLPSGECQVTVHGTHEDPREELARAIVRAGFGLRELHSRTLSLEDVFISLTTEEPQAWPD